MEDASLEITLESGQTRLKNPRPPINTEPIPFCGTESAIAVFVIRHGGYRADVLFPGSEAKRAAIIPPFASSKTLWTFVLVLILGRRRSIAAHGFSYLYPTSTKDVPSLRWLYASDLDSCVSVSEPAAVYRPRDSRASDFYACVEDNFEELERVYDERYASLKHRRPRLGIASPR